VLIPIYDALGLDWDPATTGSVEDEVPGVSVEEVIEAIVAELGERYELHEGDFDGETLARAHELQETHEIAV
jgi:octanoyl-[GcvH]:protein N-octanoyltransferase